jgi:pyruvyl transferase EpsO
LGAARDGVLVRDWAEGSVSARWRAGQLATGAWARSLGRTAAGAAPLAAAWEALARDRVAFGHRLLSRPRAMVTDRLHAHVFAVLLGLPHVVLDTGYGKIEGFWKTWTHASAVARRATTVEEALGVAEELAGG